MKDNSEIIKTYSVALAKGIISQVPVVGPLAVEIMNVSIPNHRQERIEKLLNILASKVFDITSEELERKFKSTEFIDIFEDVLLQSIRATSQERLEYLACVLKNGLSDSEFEPLQTKRILEILSKTNDIEIVILRFCGFNSSTRTESNGSQKEFKQNNISLFEDFQDNDSRQKAMFKNYQSNLINLGLLGPNRLNNSVNAFHKIYPTSELYNLSPTNLGYILLELIGIIQEKKLIGTPIDSLDVSHQLLTAQNEIEKSIKQTKENAIKEINKKSQSASEELVRQIRRLR